jgi:prepilin-type N-terminal cleavage/methylation domain-containing protein
MTHLVKKHLKKQGFTLIELLVVISIVALLIAILLPALSKARESAWKIQCLSQVKQMGVAETAYNGDNKGFFTPSSLETGDQYGLWGYTLWEYVGYSKSQFKVTDNDFDVTAGDYDNNLFNCPVTRIKKTSTPKTPLSAAYGTAGFKSFGINITLHQRDGGVSLLDAKKAPTTERDITNLSNMVLIAESKTYFTRSNEFHGNEGLIPHLGGTNFLYADMHANNLVYDQIPPFQTSLLPWASLCPEFWTGRP